MAICFVRCLAVIMAMNSVASLSPDEQQLALTQVEQVMQQQAARSHDLTNKSLSSVLAAWTLLQ
eukprot:4125826-Amphidinium_carterae.1